MLEAKGGQVDLKIDATIPAKYFNKKVTLVATPVLKFQNGGEKAYEPKTFQGEKVQGNNEVVPYATEKTVNYSGTVPFEEGMRVSGLYVKFQGSKGKKSADYESRKIADGVIATATMVNNAPAIAIGADQFERITKEEQEAAIYYLINSAQIRTKEMSSKEIKAMEKFIKDAKAAEDMELKNIQIQSYASPDGPMSFNENLANNREGAADKFVKNNMKKNKVEEYKDLDFFKKYVEYDFTAQLEEFLDDISAGQMEWKKLLTGFWNKFIKNVDAVKPLQITEVIDRIDEALSYHLFPPREDGSDPRTCPECGKGKLSVKFGKFGAFIGCSNYPECKYTKPLTDVKEEEQSDTPKVPAPEDKVLGEMNGLKVYLKKGPYGFYVQLGEDATATTEKPKRCSLPKNITPEETTFEQASRLLSLPFDLGEGITVNTGKFGPYIKQGGKSKSLTGADTIFNITLERAKTILAGAAERPVGTVLGQHPKDKADITLNNGRYGPYIKWGKNNYAIPKEYKGKEISLDDALKIIEAKK